MTAHVLLCRNDGINLLHAVACKERDGHGGGRVYLPDLYMEVGIRSAINTDIKLCVGPWGIYTRSFIEAGPGHTEISMPSIMVLSI